MHWSWEVFLIIVFIWAAVSVEMVPKMFYPKAASFKDFLLDWLFVFFFPIILIITFVFEVGEKLLYKGKKNNQPLE